MKNRYTILIVEDQPADTELIQLHLKKVDLKVDLQTTSTKADLLHTLDDRSVDLVISDYNLDGFTGEDVLDIVRDYSPDLPFILVSGYLGEKKAVQIMRSGASDYVMKDELDELIPVVERELRNYEKQLQLKQERDSALYHLEERVKEQRCLYKLSGIDEQSLSIEEFLSRAVEILPPGWQYPDITEAIIEYDGHSYQTEHYRETQWTLTAQNKTIKNAPLIVKIVYLEEKPALDIGPFLKEEQHLIDSILDRLSLKINRILDQQELQHKQDLLERSNALAKVGHWEVDLVESTTYWDREVKKIHEVRDDYTPTFDEAINFYKEGKYRDKIQETFTKAITEGESYDVELPIITAKGNERWVRAIGKPEYQDGRCVKVYGSFQDITDRKEKELELAANQRQIMAIVDNIEGVLYRYTLRPDGTDEMVYISKGIERLLGVTSDQARESTDILWNLIDKRDLDRFTKSVEESAKTLEPWHEQWRIETPQGEKKWIRGSGHPFQLEDGTILWDTLITDISQEVQQQQINEALVQEVHHRVKNNLAIITGFLELQLADLDESPAERRPLERAMTRIYSIAEVHKLLYDGTNLMDINVREYMTNLVGHVTGTMKIGDTFQVNVQVDVMDMNVNELTPVGLLLNELLTNSMKYALDDDKHGQITIKISKEDGTYEVLYQDNGPGLDQSSVENTKTSGLNIVKILLAQLEAEYQFLTDDGIRLEFTFKERSKGAHGNMRM